jgi:endonuclease/exonuclease/phosphatase family metal-dependent hydrolase
MTRLRILTYNIHKGFQRLRPALILDSIRQTLRASHADILFLQEVVGEHRGHQKKTDGWPMVPQFEYLADEVWPHHAYGKNAVTSLSHHGNAILSKYPIQSFENIDISTNRSERRGLLHVKVHIPEANKTLDLINLHLNLLHSGRKKQVDQVVKRVGQTVSSTEPLIIGGDFNDWPNKLSEPLQKSLGLQEVFLQAEGRCAKTFPSFLPILKLDRIYFRNLEVAHVVRFSGKPWSQLSDHLAIAADFII